MVSPNDNVLVKTLYYFLVSYQTGDGDDWHKKPLWEVIRVQGYGRNSSKLGAMTDKRPRMNILVGDLKTAKLTLGGLTTFRHVRSFSLLISHNKLVNPIKQH